MLGILLAGAVAGAGLWALARGLRPPLRIEDDLARLLGGAATSRLSQGAYRWRPDLTVKRTLSTRLTLGGRLHADLAVNGRTPEVHAGRCLLAVGSLAGLGVVAGFGLASAGVPVHPLVVVLIAVAAVPAGVGLVVVTERAEAAGRREDLRRTLATFLDLTSLTLAAGAGVETALVTAAGAGEGWTWDRLRGALRPARVTGASPWGALGHLGEELDVIELVELSSAVALAVSSGGRLRETLVARAASLRSRELARAQAQAASATERMTFPVVAMAFGFLFLVGFPAVARVLGAP